MSPETVRQIGLAIFVVWVPTSSQYVLSLVEGRPANKLAQYITYGGALIQIAACVAAPVLFPSVACFTAVAIELAAIACIVYVVHQRRQGKISRRKSGGLMAFLRRHSIMACAMIAAGAGFVIYVTPFL